MAKKTRYKPDYPKNLSEALDLLNMMHDEDDHDTEFMCGYRMGLRVGINQLELLRERE